MKRLMIFILTVSLLTGCENKNVSPSKASSASFEIIGHGASGMPYESNDPHFVLIKNQIEMTGMLNQFWNGTDSDLFNATVDFNSDEVIFVFPAGGNTGGWTDEISSVEELPFKIQITAKKTPPSCEGAVTQSFVFPYLAIKLKKSGKPIQITFDYVPRNCGN